MECFAVLVPAPIVGLPFILHLCNRFAGTVAFLSGRVLTRKSSFAAKECLVTAVVRNASLGHKMVPSRRVLEGNTGEMKHYFIIAKEHRRPPSDTIVLYIGQLMVRGTQDSAGLVTPNDRCLSVTVLICLCKVEEVRHSSMWHLPPVQSAFVQYAPRSIYQLRPQNIV